jgi:hypothetical protein
MPPFEQVKQIKQASKYKTGMSEVSIASLYFFYPCHVPSSYDSFNTVPILLPQFNHGQFVQLIT